MDTYILLAIVVMIITQCIASCMLVFTLLHGDHSLTIIQKQEFSEEDRQLLEDLFNEKGELKDQEYEVKDALAEITKAVNSVMLDIDEEETNG